MEGNRLQAVGSDQVAAVNIAEALGVAIAVAEDAASAG
jgi:hypothetical protein